MNYSYDTLVEALNDLNKRGYKHDFNLEEDTIVCKETAEVCNVDDFEVNEFYRFEGASNPDDLSEVYAIETVSGTKGVLTDGVGISSALTPAMIKKLRTKF